MVRKRKNNSLSLLIRSRVEIQEISYRRQNNGLEHIVLIKTN